METAVGDLEKTVPTEEIGKMVGEGSQKPYEIPVINVVVTLREEKACAAEEVESGDTSDVDDTLTEHLRFHKVKCPDTSVTERLEAKVRKISLPDVILWPDAKKLVG
ncbi:unnamed protein product [Caretta caretta]